jgi:hypothetical protein
VSYFIHVCCITRQVKAFHLRITFPEFQIIKAHWFFRQHSRVLLIKPALCKCRSFLASLLSVIEFLLVISHSNINIQRLFLIFEQA